MTVNVTCMYLSIFKVWSSLLGLALEFSPVGGIGPVCEAVSTCICRTGPVCESNVLYSLR